MPNRRRLSLTWIDFLVIAATVLTFGAVVMASIPNGKSSMRISAMTTALPRDVPVEISQMPDDPDLVRARIGLAIGGPRS
ncbi:MAG: hypothetical protein Q8M19_17480 [Reyranella sp.]|nr:hypothetical protein [Reyranella sp.]